MAGQRFSLGTTVSATNKSDLLFAGRGFILRFVGDFFLCLDLWEIFFYAYFLEGFFFSCLNLWRIFFFMLSFVGDFFFMLSFMGDLFFMLSFVGNLFFILSFVGDFLFILSFVGYFLFILSFVGDFLFILSFEGFFFIPCLVWEDLFLYYVCCFFFSYLVLC